MHQLSCRCGSVRGHIRDGRPSNRVRCFCRDCQAFAAHLGAEATVLDAHGGTEILQVSQARLVFDTGLGELACLRLSPTGLLRWYAGCCNTPIGNTLPNPKVSLIGLVHSCLDRPSLDRDFGSGVANVNTGAAVGEPRPPGSGLLSTLAKFVAMTVADRVSGRYRQSPLFSGNGVPIAEPRVLGGPGTVTPRRRP